MMQTNMLHISFQRYQYPVPLFYPLPLSYGVVFHISGTFTGTPYMASCQCFSRRQRTTPEVPPVLPESLECLYKAVFSFILTMMQSVYQTQIFSKIKTYTIAGISVVFGHKFEVAKDASEFDSILLTIMH